MINLSHVGSHFYSSSTTGNNNVAHDGHDLLLDYWSADPALEAVLGSVPVVEEGLVNTGVFEGMENNGVVGNVVNKGKEPMVGAAEELVGSNKEASGGGNEEFVDFDFDLLYSSVGWSEMVDEIWELVDGEAPPGSNMQHSLSGFGESASGGSDEGGSMFADAIEMVGVEAAAQGVVNKRGAEWMGVAPLPARGSKRQRSPSGWIETASGGGSDVSDEGRPSKRLWVKDRVLEDVWWDKVDRPGYTHADFKRDFHMSRSTFSKLCDMLAPFVAKEDTQMRTAIPVHKRVAVCVFRLSTGESYRRLQKRFGIGISTVRKLVLGVSYAITNIVLPQVVLWPDATSAASAAAKFQALTGGIPDIVGAVYTTHISVKAPQSDVIEYHNAGLTARNNGRNSYSITLQASVDADGAFTNVFVYTGTVPDGDLLLESPLRGILGQGKRLVGGASYPLMDWMLVPYAHQNLTYSQHQFNLKVAAARAVAVDAFRRLKTSWACLRLRDEIKVKALPSIVSACCALQNFCERNGDELDPEQPRFKLDDDDLVAANPVGSAAAAEVRDAMANNLLE